MCLTWKELRKYLQGNLSVLENSPIFEQLRTTTYWCDLISLLLFFNYCIFLFCNYYIVFSIAFPVTCWNVLMNFRVWESSHKVKVSRLSSYVRGALFERLCLCKLAGPSSTAGLEIGQFFVQHSWKDPFFLVPQGLIVLPVVFSALPATMTWANCGLRGAAWNWPRNYRSNSARM